MPVQERALMHPVVHSKPCLPYHTHHVLSKSPLTQRPHLLQVPDDSHIRIHVSIHTVLHARLLVPVQRALGDAASNAFLEAHRVELMDG